MARLTKAQMMAGLRDRRRRGIAVAKVRLDPVERRKLIVLGYLDRSLLHGERGPAIDAAVEAYLSDRLAEERVG
jgi:hypothetical protein